MGLNFVSAAIVFTGSSVLRYSNEIKSPGLSGSRRSRYSRVANRRYAKIESSSITKIKKKNTQKAPGIRAFYARRRIVFILFARRYRASNAREIKITDFSAAVTATLTL